MQRFVKQTLRQLFCEVTTNKNCVTPYCHDPRLKQDIRLIFVSNYFVLILKNSRWTILITALTSSGSFETLWYLRGFFKFLSCFEPRLTIVCHGSVQVFLVDKVFCINFPFGNYPLYQSRQLSGRMNVSHSLSSLPPRFNLRGHGWVFQGVIQGWSHLLPIIHRSRRTNS